MHFRVRTQLLVDVVMVALTEQVQIEIGEPGRHSGWRFAVGGWRFVQKKDSGIAECSPTNRQPQTANR
jgi:hypothetical protein